MESRVCLKRSRAALSDKVEEMNENGFKINKFLEKIRENEARDSNDFVKVLSTKAADIKPKKKFQSSTSNSSSRDKLYDFLDDVAHSIPECADSNSSSSETSDGNSSDDSSIKEGVSNRSTNLLNNIDAIGSIIKSNSFWNDLFMMECESLAASQSDSASKSRKVNVIEY
jgi:hypothetical protein